MISQLKLGEEITIDGLVYTIGEHPAAKGFPYGQEGRQGVVYQLIPQIETSSGWKALKVFRKQFCNPKMVYLSENLQRYANLPGLQVCDRTVLTPQQYNDLLARHEELIYSVVMPWIEGPTWMDVMLEKRKLDPRESLLLARSLAKVLSNMEQRGLAHCDISGSNVLLPKLVKNNIEDGFSYVELVDVEQMYAPGYEKPDVLVGGSPGYYGKNISSNLWSGYADRFAGAILLAEMLGWCDEEVRNKAYGESYFAPKEIQQESERYTLLLSSLHRNWGDKIATLFEQVWQSVELHQCPTFGEWLVVLMGLGENVDQERESIGISKESTSINRGKNHEISVEVGTELSRFETFAESVETEDLETQIAKARELEKKGDLQNALYLYKQVRRNLPVNDSLAQEISLIMKELEMKVPDDHQQSPKKPVQLSFLKKPKYIWISGAAIVLLGSVFLFLFSEKFNLVIEDSNDKPTEKINVTPPQSTKPVEAPISGPVVIKFEEGDPIDKNKFPYDGGHDLFQSKNVVFLYTESNHPPELKDYVDWKTKDVIVAQAQRIMLVDEYFIPLVMQKVNEDTVEITIVKKEFYETAPKNELPGSPENDVNVEEYMEKYYGHSVGRVLLVIDKGILKPDTKFVLKDESGTILYPGVGANSSDQDKHWTEFNNSSP